MTKLTLTPSELSQKASGLNFPQQTIHAEQATVSTAVIWRGVALRKCHLQHIMMGLATTGTANDTDVQVKKDGVQIGSTGTIDNTEADGTTKSVAIAADIEEGAVVTVEVTAAPTGGAGLHIDGALLLDFDS